MAIDVVVLMEYVDIALLDVVALIGLFSFRRFSNSIFCEVISIVALLSRKKSSLAIGPISRSCFWKRSNFADQKVSGVAVVIIKYNTIKTFKK